MRHLYDINKNRIKTQKRKRENTNEIKKKQKPKKYVVDLEGPNLEQNEVFSINVKTKDPNNLKRHIKNKVLTEYYYLILFRKDYNLEDVDEAYNCHNMKVYEKMLKIWYIDKPKYKVIKITPVKSFITCYGCKHDLCSQKDHMGTNGCLEMLSYFS